VSLWRILGGAKSTADKSVQVTDDLKKADRAERLELYKLMVEMADRVSQRRQAANSFYLSINTLLVGGSAYLGTTTASVRTTLLVSLAGTLVSIYWVKAIESYKTLNNAKFSIINTIEESLVIRPFTDEWAKLDPDGDGKRHKPFHVTEKFVPKVFMGMYAFQVLAIIPWSVIWRRILASAC
jgi:hypothetical protein